MRKEDATLLAIAKYLNENGYKSARGKNIKKFTDTLNTEKEKNSRRNNE